MLKQQKGITLLTLVLAIVVLLFLAAVAIAMVLDELKYDPEPVEVQTSHVISTNDANQETPVPTEEVAETPAVIEETQN